jgi:Protein of unknown function (DUF2939)
MRKTYLFGLLAALVVAVPAGWYFASPWLTLRAMVSAAKANDAERFSAHVDYDSLRRDVKAEVLARLEAEPKRKRGLAGRLGAAVGRTVAGPAIDAAVSPDGLKAAFAVLDRGGASPAESAGADSARKASLPSIERQGLDRFRVAHPAIAGAAFRFERHGLGWKLAGIDFGREAAAPGA